MQNTTKKYGTTRTRYVLAFKNNSKNSGGHLKNWTLIIYRTKINLSISKQYKHWFADGTFKVIYQLDDIFLP